MSHTYVWVRGQSGRLTEGFPITALAESHRNRRGEKTDESTPSLSQPLSIFKTKRILPVRPFRKCLSMVIGILGHPQSTLVTIARVFSIFFSLIHDSFTIHSFSFVIHPLILLMHSFVSSAPCHSFIHPLLHSPIAHSPFILH